MDEMTFGWLVQYEQELKKAGYSDEEIAKLVLMAVE